MTNIVEMLGGSQCVSCHTWRTPAKLEAVTINSERHMPVNTLAGVKVQTEAIQTTFHVCEDCADAMSSPGKYQAVHETDRALCLVLESIALDGCADESLSDEWQGTADRIGRYVLLCDPYGFVTVDTYADADKAQAQLDSAERDGFGADESDGWIADDRNGYSVSLEGTHIGTYPRYARARAALALACRDSGCYPSLWRQDERGGIRAIYRDIPYLEGSQIAPSAAQLEAEAKHNAERSAT